MATLFETLPGQAMPVKEVGTTLATMWSVDRPTRNAVPLEFRASQMNVVLHFGLKTPLEEGLARFNALVDFAQRYPCRIIVLCPEGRERTEANLTGKLFALCYLGTTLRNMCCCEALMLNYPTREAGFLDNMVSIWLENDLPTYHWFHRVPEERIRDLHLGFVKNCRRVLYDSSIELTDFSEIPWPRPEAARDIARARLLSIRQSLGQFLSGYQPDAILTDLAKVEVCHNGARKGEGLNLLRWCEVCLHECARRTEAQFAVEMTLSEGTNDEDHCLEMNWTYTGTSKHLRWTHGERDDDANLTADLGEGRVSFPVRSAFLSPSGSVSEAIFFD